MKLIPSRPVTIHAERHAQRWFPYFFRHTDGSLLLYIEHGYDGHFAPCFRLRSIDDGRTWLEEQENLPRTAWRHSFDDCELLEIDTYGFLDPNAEHTYAYYGAWSTPGRAGDEVRRELVRVYSPSLGTVPLTELQKESAYPAFPWWPLFNKIHGSDEVRGEDVLIGGPIFTSGVEIDGRLVALGYNIDVAQGMDTGQSVSSVVCLESFDHGLTWKEISIVARGTTETLEGFNESTLVQLKDGRLYSVIRSGNFLFQTWSSDGGHTWSTPAQLRLIDSDIEPRMVWPICQVLDDGTLVLVYGRPGKHMIFDPSGTGEQWQGHLDLHAWELETQEIMGVPPELCLHGDTNQCVRYWDSGDYLGIVATGPREMLVVYDVQNFYENWNALPIAGVRMVRVRLDD